MNISEFINEILLKLLKGSLVTIELTVIAIFFGTILALLLTLAKVSKNKVLSGIASFYTWFFRGTPLMLQLIFLYYGLPAFKITLSSFQTAIIGLSMNNAAYMAEIIRAGIESIDKGQTEAAKALGMSYFDTMRRVILPQAYRRMIPPAANEFIALIKDTSLVSVIAMTDLMKDAFDIVSSKAILVEPLLVAAILYLIMTTFFTYTFHKLEKKLSIYE